MDYFRWTKSPILKKHHKGFINEMMSESHMEMFIFDHWVEIFDFIYLSARMKISKRSIIDMLGFNKDCFYIIELKYRPIRAIDIKQVNRYVKDFKIYSKTELPIKTFLISYNHINREINIFKGII